MKLLNERTRRDLEFDKVLELVKRHAASALGQEAVSRLKPQTQRDGIVAEFARISDCMKAVRDESFRVGHTEQIDRELNQAQEATTIAPEDFLPVLNALEMIRQLDERISALKRGDALKAMGQEIDTFPTLEGFIRRSISEKGDIRDDASPQLRQLTKRYQTAESRAKRKLEALLSSASNVIQESVITRRGGRFVVPVKSHLRHQLDGIVQDSSGSGQTLFLEPTSVVKENNQMRELDGEIRDEKLRILQALTDKLREETPKIRKSLKTYAWIDSVYARAQYALHTKSVIPELNTQGVIKMSNARHPLLDPKTVVPISFKLGNEYQGMVITGPNTGGKTITLKTVGLLTLMAQSGIPVPANENCQLTLFGQVRSDIGDEQSIEQNLSTFSSHLKNIVSILSDIDEAADQDTLSLVLLDEVGAGTDPQEGTALGVALLQSMLASKTRLMVTTHYSALKRFAYGHPKLKNASVEFDLETLAPTYKLLEGVPGASNAFLIAKRLGLSEDLIETAKRTLDEGEVRTEDVIRELQAEHAALDAEREAFREAKRGLEAKVQHYQQRLAQLETEQQAALGEESQRLHSELKQARQALEDALHAARNPQDEDALKDHLHQVVDATDAAHQVQAALDKPQNMAIQSLDDLELDQWVQVKGFRKPARVVEIDDESRIRVDLDGLRVWTKLADLTTTAPQEKSDEPTIRTSGIDVESHAAPPVELDVMGMNVVDALRLVDQYLNQLLLVSREQGFILHGKGTGALRRAIRDHLKKLSWVKESYAAPPSQGGDGVTVVRLG